jgi:GNAT superfamily N-acetyltransferase
MSEFLDRLSGPTVTKAMEANFSRLFTALFASEDFQFKTGVTSGPLLYASGLPFPLCNGVLQTNFSMEEADQKIAETMEYFKTRELPMIWFVLPSSKPADLAERLLAQGLVKLEEDTGMELDLTSLPDEEVAVPGLELRRVADKSVLKEWIDTFLKGFGLPDFLDEPVYKLVREFGFDQDADLHNFLAYLDGKPVATSTLFCADGVAAIYNVTTLEEVRGHGIGREITRTAVLKGRAKGYKVAVLEATTMGYNVYRKLGFTDNCKIGQYMWRKETKAG